MKDYNINHPEPVKAPRSRKKIAIIVAAVLLVAVILIGAFWYFFRSTAEAPAPQETTPVVVEEEVTKEKPSVPELPNLQPTVDSWAATTGGTVSVKITDTNGKVLATYNADKTYFTASIYKLYVAYVGYQKIDDGTYSLNDPYLSGYTRGECLDAMIRDSNSACGEKMWAELGKSAITEKMKSYGLKNTSLTGLQTTSEDAAVILANIANGKDLKPASQKAYLDSMKIQDALYRRGLPAGFKKLTVYNKVGWNLTQEWHDTAIVQTKNGQKLIVSVFTNGAGYKSITALGAKIEAELQ
jgi:beta-lactamase class A